MMDESIRAVILKTVCACSNVMMFACSNVMLHIMFVYRKNQRGQRFHHSK